MNYENNLINNINYMYVVQLILILCCEIKMIKLEKNKTN